MAEKLIWYVCYGSNLAEERFLCYFNGKTSERCHINKGHLYGDGSFKPRKSKKWHLDFKLYFANDGESSNWGTSGVAFLDTTIEGKTLARAYLISEDEYNWLRRFEGRSYPWYDKEIVLGTMKEDGYEIRTITCDMPRTPKEPMKEYLDVMKAGLIETGFTEIEVIRYLNGLFPPEEGRKCPVCGNQLGLGELIGGGHLYFCTKCGYSWQPRILRNKILNKKCPDCKDGNLVVRKGWDKKKKQIRHFLGCTNFPRCRHIEEYDPECSEP